MLLLGIFVLTYGIFIPIDYLAVQGFQEAHMSEEMAQYPVSIFNLQRCKVGRQPAPLPAPQNIAEN